MKVNSSPLGPTEQPSHTTLQDAELAYDPGRSGPQDNPAVGGMHQKLTCGYPYCDQLGLVYVARTVGGSGRLTVIVGDRAEQLGSAYPLEVRCIDCAHHELDLLIADIPCRESNHGPH